MKLSLRGRVLTIFSAIMLTVMTTGGFILLSNAQEAIKAEIAASRNLAKKLTLAVIGSLIRVDETGQILTDISLQLQQPRHVRIHVLNLQGEPINTIVTSPEKMKEHISNPPKWFDSWLRPSMGLIRVPITKNNRPLGVVIITTEPRDEIAEVWEDLLSLFIVMIVGYFLLLAAIYWALGQALKPLTTISKGMELLESGDYSIELPPILVPDLNQIGVRFNALASALDRTTKEKEELSEKLITVQDTERKNIALELHDEFGPCLFGIKVDASFIEANAATALNGAGSEITERATAILKIVDHIQAHNRALLYRLRPMAFEHFGISQLLEELVNDFRNRYTQTTWELHVPADFESGGETFDLTVYRMIQECLTNAARHANATKVKARIEFVVPQNGNSRKTKAVKVTVSDNGDGLGPDHQPGLGLSGMAQRVQGLGGKFEMSSPDNGGTIIGALIPMTSLKQASPQTETDNYKGAQSA